MDHNVTKDSPVDLTNATLGSSLTPPTTNWGWVSIASIIMLITAFGLNLMALLRFLTDMTLISPFNLLIVNLVLANVVYFIILGPLDFINGLYTGWWLGEAWCTIYMYGLWVLSLVQMSSHPLIAIDRLWAVSFPINYRKVHNKRFILLLCSGAWLLAHLVALPVVITDARYYRLPVATNGCSINLGIPFQNAWVIMVQCVCLLLVFIVLFAFPVIAYKLKSRKKIGAGATANQSSNNTGGSSTHNVTTDQYGGMVTALTPVTRHGWRAKTEKRSHGFLLLSLLTTSICICWTPVEVYYMLLPFLDIFDPTVVAIMGFLYGIEGIIDPILLALSLKDFRKSLKKVVCK